MQSGVPGYQKTGGAGRGGASLSSSSSAAAPKNPLPQTVAAVRKKKKKKKKKKARFFRDKTKTYYPFSLQKRAAASSPSSGPVRPQKPAASANVMSVKPASQQQAAKKTGK